MVGSKQTLTIALFICGTAFNATAAVDSSDRKVVSPVPASSTYSNDNNGLSVPAPDTGPVSNNSNTAIHQSNNKWDIKTVAAVRRAVIRDKSLSTRAHNVTITAVTNVVTLSGYVTNPDEKAKIEAIASRVKNVTQVVNQLQIAQQ